jgi:hypothetical protein
MVLMWSFHRRSLLMVTPRYLLESTSWSMCPWMVYWALIGLRLLETHITTHFSGWKAICHLFSHSSSELRSFCRICVSHYFVLVETTGSHLRTVWHRIQFTLVDRWWIVRRAKAPVPCLMALQIAHQRWSIYGPLVVLLAFDGLGSIGSIKRCYSGFHNTWACVVNICVVPYRTLSKNLVVLRQLALQSLVFGLFPQLWWWAVFHMIVFSENHAGYLTHNMECSSRWSITWLCIICSISLHVIEIRETGW